MKQILCLLACVLLMACGSKTEESKTEAAADHATQQVALHDMTVELAVRHASCGCALEAVGSCGNYVEIESQFVEIANGDQFGLGEMEWCGKQGAKIETAGEIKNGEFVAATLVKK
jgi:hypothetical protein